MYCCICAEEISAKSNYCYACRARLLIDNTTSKEPSEPLLLKEKKLVTFAEFKRRKEVDHKDFTKKEWFEENKTGHAGLNYPSWYDEYKRWGPQNQTGILSALEIFTQH